MGLFGAALIYGDGVITPAISVLSALEGLNVATNVFKTHIVPVALVILIGLFAIQSRGTARIGKISGPVMLLWFIVTDPYNLVCNRAACAASQLRRPDRAALRASRHGR
jgi:K+ transporter